MMGVKRLPPMTLLVLFTLGCASLLDRRDGDPAVDTSAAPLPASCGEDSLTRAQAVLAQMQPSSLVFTVAEGAASVDIRGDGLFRISSAELQSRSADWAATILRDACPLTGVCQLDLRVDSVVPLGHGAKSYRFQQRVHGARTTDIVEIEVTAAGNVRRIAGVLANPLKTQPFVIQRSEAIQHAREALRTHFNVADAALLGERGVNRYYATNEDLQAIPFWEIKLEVTVAGVQTVRVDAVTGGTEVLDLVEDAAASWR